MKFSNVYLFANFPNVLSTLITTYEKQNFKYICVGYD